MKTREGTGSCAHCTDCTDVQFTSYRIADLSWGKCVSFCKSVGQSFDPPVPRAGCSVHFGNVLEAACAALVESYDPQLHRAPLHACKISGSSRRIDPQVSLCTVIILLRILASLNLAWPSSASYLLLLAHGWFDDPSLNKRGKIFNKCNSNHFICLCQ